MGHYWREMDPEGARRQDERLARLSKIQDEIKEMPLSAFHGGDLEALHRVAGLHEYDAEEEHFKLIEKRIAEYKKTNKKKKHRGSD